MNKLTQHKNATRRTKFYFMCQCAITYVFVGKKHNNTPNLIAITLISAAKNK